MAQPPAGYSLQRGAYFTADGQGPYSWDGATMSLLGSNGGATAVMKYPFSAAGDFLVQVGPGTVYGVFITTSALGAVEVEDGTLAGAGPDLLASTALAVTTDNNRWIPIGGSAGLPFTSGLLLRLTGAQVGYILHGE